MSEYKKGDLIVFKTHPFINESINIKISAYPEYTSPILIIKEAKNSSFEKETGINIGQQLNCMYYNSRDGKFTEKWISSNLINKISFSILSHKILLEIDLKKQLNDSKKELSNKNYENLIKASYLNKKVVLKSVDLELFKIKINRTKENGELLENNHLEFLPPIMTVIDFKYSDQKHKYCEKTGLPLIELKCKWYNSNSKSFSESFFDYDILYYIKETQELFDETDLLADISESLDKNLFFILPLEKKFPLELEDNKTKKETLITKTIAHSYSISFKHYFYQMNHFDYVTQKKSSIPIDNPFTTIQENILFGKKYPNYDKGYKSKTSDCKFKIDNYYYIVYKDTFHNITRRIVKVKDLFIYIKDFKKFKKDYKELESWNHEENISSVNYKYHEDGKIFIHLDGLSIPSNTLPKTIFEDTNIEIMLNTNCLFRKGKIRNFKLNQILEVREITNEQNIFEN
jgi:hypothetical protein